MSLTALPTAPDAVVDDSDAFDLKAAAFAAALVNLVNEWNSDISVLNALGFYGLSLTVDTSSTADADPGQGKVRFNSATQNLSTVFRIDDLDANGISIAALIQTFDDAAEALKGTLLLVSKTNRTKQLALNLTSLAAGVGYTNLTGTVVVSSAANPFTNGEAVDAIFYRNTSLNSTLVASAVRDGAYNYGLTGGAANAYTLTLTPAPAALTNGMKIRFRVHANPGVGPSTINVNGLGAKALVRRAPFNGFQALVGGTFSELRAGQNYEATYDGTRFVLDTPRDVYYTSVSLASSSQIQFNVPEDATVVILNINGASTNNTNPLTATINNETTGYTGVISSGTATPTITFTGNSTATGFRLTGTVAAAQVYHGQAIFVRNPADGSWGMVSTFLTTTNVYNNAGSKTAAAANMSVLTLSLNGTADLFDAGTASLIAF